MTEDITSKTSKVKFRYFKYFGLLVLFVILYKVTSIPSVQLLALSTFRRGPKRPEYCPVLNDSFVVPRLHEFCGNKTRLRNNWLEMIKVYKVLPTSLVSIPNRKYVWMSIPKVASSNWKRMILIDLLGQFTERDVHKKIEECCILTEEIAKLRQADRYFTFTFIRNPWTRLYSAYMDKIRLWPGFERFKYIREIMVIIRGEDKTILDVTTDFNYKDYDNVSFNEFLLYLTMIASAEYDMHWAPWFDIVEACEVRFDFIGHVEDMDGIFQAIRERVFEHKVKLPPPYTKQASRNQVIEAYKEVPADVKEELYQRFYIDFMVGGYSKDINCI